MKMVLLIFQIVLSFILTGAIVLQSQGSGLGPTWGGGGESYHTRRGIEKLLFAVTIVGTACFAVVSSINALFLR